MPSVLQGELHAGLTICRPHRGVIRGNQHDAPPGQAAARPRRQARPPESLRRAVSWWCMCCYRSSLSANESHLYRSSHTSEERERDGQGRAANRGGGRRAAPAEGGSGRRGGRGGRARAGGASSYSMGDRGLSSSGSEWCTAFSCHRMLARGRARDARPGGGRRPGASRQHALLRWQRRTSFCLLEQVAL